MLDEPDCPAPWAAAVDSAVLEDARADERVEGDDARCDSEGDGCFLGHGFTPTSLNMTPLIFAIMDN